jgi:hypothetical protein
MADGSSVVTCLRGDYLLHPEFVVLLQEIELPVGLLGRYPGGSQLATAVAVPHTHRGRVLLITIEISANDPRTAGDRTCSRLPPASEPAPRQP